MPKQKKYENEIKSVWIKYFRIFLATISGFALSVIFVKFFTPEEYGSYSFIIQMSSSVLVITSLGLSTTLIRFIPEYIQKKNYNSINILIKYSVTLRVISLLLILSLILLFSKQLSNYFNQNELFQRLIPLIVIFIFLNSINPLLRTIFYTAYSQEYINDYLEIFKITMITLGFWVLLRNNYGLYAIILCLIIVNSIIFVILIIKAIKEILNNKNKKNETFVPFEKKRIFKYSSYNFLTGTTGFLRDTAVDIFVISYFLNNEKVAFYSLGSSLALYLSKINPAEVLKNIFYPLIFKEFSAQNNNIEILKKYSLFLTKLSLFTVMPFLIIILIYAKEIINYIYNPEYSESILILQIFVGFYFFRIFIRSYKIFFHSLEKNKFIFITSLLGIVNFILSIIFIQFWNIASVALSTGITWAINLIIFALILKYNLKISFSFFNKQMLKLFVNILIFSVILLAFKVFIVNLSSLLGLSFISLIIYLTISIFNKSFTLEERSFINSITGRKIWKF